MSAFIALEPDGFRFQVVELARYARSKFKGRFVSPDNHHLTLAFLDDVGEHDVRLVMDAMDEACACANRSSRISQ